MTYYLVKGRKIGNKDLPGGEINAEKASKAVTEKDLAPVKDSIEYLVAVGVLSTSVPADILEKVEKAEDPSREELFARAEELGLKVDSKIGTKKLTDAIEKAESELEAE